jgi:hypothetical protein
MAKDGNRPFLMRRAFSEDATLDMVVRTDAISFPSSGRGLAAIEDMVGRRFADDFENVYTFCLSRPDERHGRHFPCHWLVGMSAKKNGPIRVGCGRYDWYFTEDARCLIERAIITIEAMQQFPATDLERIMAWLAALPYPWCTPADALRGLPELGELAPIKHYLKSARPIAPER